MNEWRQEHRFAARLVMLGHGSIGQGVLPLLLRHIENSVPRSREGWAKLAQQLGSA